MPTLIDDLGRTLELAAPADRVVSLAPFLTETVLRLGAAERLVGISETCPSAEHAVDPPRMGTVRAPSVTAIAAMHPDLVLVSAAETSMEAVQALEAAGIRVFGLQARNVEAAGRMVKSLGALLGHGRTAEELVREADDRVEDVRARVRGLPSPRVLHLVWRNPYHSVGPRTYAHDLIERAGGRNIWCRAAVDHPVTRPEEIGRMDPEVVILPSHPYPFSVEDVDEVFIELGCAATLDGRVHLVPGTLMHWPGLRYAEALELLASILHP